MDAAIWGTGLRPGGAGMGGHTAGTDRHAAGRPAGPARTDRSR
ncbi:hypothetical protein AB0J86_37695 [Micromonospora sp. NPDC049559]